VLLPFFGVGKMKKILNIFVLFFLASFFFANFAQAQTTYKYSCDHPMSYAGGYNCPDPSYKFTDPVEAAESAITSYKAWWKDQVYKEKFVSFSKTSPECSYWDPNTPQYYVLRCTYRYRITYVDTVGGPWIQTAYTDSFVFVVREHPCEFNVALKGTLGAVISSSQSDGKKYILSQNPGEPACVSTCSYNLDRQDKCYLTIGSETEGFCNYNYKLGLDASGNEQRCQTNPSIKPAEIGDEITDKCSDGYEFANGSKMCTLIPCPEGSERLEGSETCTPIPKQPGGGGSSGDGGTGGSTGGGTGGGTGGSGGGTGGGTSGTGGGTGSDGGTGGGTGGTGGDTGGDGVTGGGTGGDGGGETFTPPGPLDLSASVAGRGAQAKSQLIDMKQKMVASSTFTTAKSAFSGSSHAAAVCPVGSVSLFSKEIVFDSHCKLFALISPILKAVFIAVWSFLAVRIILTA